MDNFVRDHTNVKDLGSLTNITSLTKSPENHAQNLQNKDVKDVNDHFPYTMRASQGENHLE